jgi:hypothetical protein
MSWRVAKSLLHLRDQINAKVPNRNKRNDGTIGDAAHAARTSDHNPWVHDGDEGVVTAMDITNDPQHGVISRKIAEALVASRDPRIKYIISNRQIVSSKVSPWRWREYDGPNPHTEHVHISVQPRKALYDDQRDWSLPASFGFPGQPLPHPETFSNSGKGSWYSQFNGKYDWVDDDDEPNSNALNVPDSAQGISFYDRSTLGRWFEVKAPNGKVSTEQQTDIGPNPRTGRKIDISAAAAERLGYSPRNFPTDSIFYWRQIETPTNIRNLDRKTQAIRYRDLRERHGKNSRKRPPALAGADRKGARR